VRILYIFPHPDDESFGPAPGIARQLRDGHEVHLLTLTRGGATRVRHDLGLSVQEMGEVRYREMLEVERVLGLTGMEVLDLPDSGLRGMNPIDIESIVEDRISRVRPDIVVTYAVHGVSGFHDHLVTHAVVKRVWCSMAGEGGRLAGHRLTRSAGDRSAGDRSVGDRSVGDRSAGEGKGAPRRLALFTLPESASPPSGSHTLHTSPDSEIDARIRLQPEDLDAGRRALDCYTTYREVIQRARPLETIGTELCYEFFGESFEPPLGDLTQALPDAPRLPHSGVLGG
jgi:N-acetylglucosamine malate deacetylase 2